METLSAIRSDGEADIAEILANLDERHRAILRDAIQEHGRVQDIPKRIWDGIRSDTTNESALAIYFLMLNADDWTTGSIADQGTAATSAGRDQRAAYKIAAQRRAERMADSTGDTIRDRLGRKHEDAKLE